MNLLNFLKRKSILFVLLVASFSIFLYYLKQNYNVYYYDEGGYLGINKAILSQGLFNMAEPLRTYLYPLIISIISIFTNGDLFVLKILLSILQYIVYIYTVIVIASTFQRISNSNIVYNFILLFGLLNPYLIQSTTLMLTDILSACLIVWAIMLIIRSDFSSNKDYLLLFLFSYGATMIRPSSLIFVTVVILLLIIRKYMLKDVNLVKATIFAIIALVMFVPQFYNNVHQFNHWTPLVHEDLYQFQSNLAASNLKYGTVVIPNENPQLFAQSPFAVDTTTGIYKLLFTNFLAFVVAYASHLFGVLDWGYIETYINDFYPKSRIIGSWYLYTFWIFAIYGTVSFIRKEKSVQGRFILITLVGAFFMYWAFIGTTIIESRFGYPLLLLLLPFSGIGVLNLFNNIKDSEGALRNKKVSIYAIIYVVVILLVFYLSFLLDYQTGRINWLGFK